MIDIPTLFILGAGASKPYGYPTGAELRADIIKNFTNYFLRLEDVHKNSVPHVPRASRNIEKFVENFSKSSITSIDKYLSLNPMAAYYGKMGITLSILNSEKESSFREDMKNPHEDWYTYLFNRMMDGLNKPDDYKKFHENRVAFITFNYDKSLEYFLYDSFYHAFYERRHDIEGNIKELIPFPVIHVYGIVAELDTLRWPEHNYKDEYINNSQFIEKLSKEIRVIGEERSGESIKDQIKKILPAYERIFFLGFGYAQDNFDAIDVLNQINFLYRIFGTAQGMTSKEIGYVKNRFSAIRCDARLAEEALLSENDMVINPIIEHKNCYDLLREYL